MKQKFHFFFLNEGKTLFFNDIKSVEKWEWWLLMSVANNWVANQFCGYLNNWQTSSCSYCEDFTWPLYVTVSTSTLLFVVAAWMLSWPVLVATSVSNAALFLALTS